MLGLPENVTVVPAAHWGLQEDIRRARLVFGPPVSKEGLTGAKSAQAVELSRRIMAAIAPSHPNQAEFLGNFSAHVTYNIHASKRTLN